MPKVLTEAQIATYERDGYLAPVPVMSEAEARALRAHLETIEAGMGGPLRGDIRHKAHLLFPFLADLIRHPKILDAIEDVLGPDILCWNTNFFVKEAETPSFDEEIGIPAQDVGEYQFLRQRSRDPFLCLLAPG